LKNTIDHIVENSLCTGCGACKTICSTNAIQMCENESGFIFANINDNTCNGCGACARICPRAKFPKALLSDVGDPFEGKVLKVFSGYATDQVTREESQSGGFTTALLTHLLETDQISKALVTEMPEDGSLRPKPFWAKNKSDLLRAVGSKYCPVSTASIIPLDFDTKEGPRAVVGTPCQIHGVRKLQSFKTELNDAIPLTIGLFCESILSYHAMDFLIRNGNKDKSLVKSFRYKYKKKGGWPGYVTISSEDGESFLHPSKRMSCKSSFTPTSCRLCFDKLNVLADISVGDPYAVSHERKGETVVVVRTKNGMKALMSAADAGKIIVRQASFDDLTRGQKIEDKKKDWAAYNYLRSKAGYEIPNALDSELIARYLPAQKKKYVRELRYASLFNKASTVEKKFALAGRHILLEKTRRFLSCHFWLSVVKFLARKITNRWN